MKALTVLLPKAVVAQIEADSRAHQMSKSHIVCERLSTTATTAAKDLERD